MRKLLSATSSTILNRELPRHWQVCGCGGGGGITDMFYPFPVRLMQAGKQASKQAKKQVTKQQRNQARKASNKSRKDETQSLKPKAQDQKRLPWHPVSCLIISPSKLGGSSAAVNM